ncbi:MAG: hypothetical protein RJA30_714 [Actinomycetota bacterium]
MSDSGIGQLLGSLGQHATTVEVINPGTGKVSYHLPQFSYEEVQAVTEIARSASAEWADTPVRERAAIMLRLHDLMLKHQERILELIQFETGKTKAGAFEDFAGALFAARHYGKRAPKLLHLTRTKTDAPFFVRNYIDYDPVGVVGIITPWNFPMALPGFDVIPALLAGNTVVHKVDNQTALTGLYFRQLALDAGLPENVWNIVVGSGPDAGNGVTDSVDYVAFTGSTATGHLVAERAAKRLIGFSLELGGKNAAIVLPNANLKRSAKILVTGAIGNAGQICVSIERCYVPNQVRDQFIDLVSQQLDALKYGRTSSYDTEMGSLTSASQLKRVMGFLAEATSKGFKVIGGEPKPEYGPFFISPAIVVEPTDELALNRSEVFGPVIQIYGYDDLDEAIAAANDSEFGLNASVLGPTGDALKVARLIQAGSVNINDGYRASFGSMSSPMGGVKLSGHGRRNGDGGLLRFTEPKAIGVASGMFKLPTRASDYNRVSKLLVILTKVLRRF